MKTEVYSWRVSAELKTTLEREAHRRQTPVSALLDQAVRNFLADRDPNSDDEEEQRRLHSAALSCLGSFAGGNPDRAANTRQTLRQRLRQKQNA